MSAGTCGLCGGEIVGASGAASGVKFCHKRELKDDCYSLVTRYHVALPDGRQWQSGAGWVGPYQCPSECDEGCLKDCHEAHYPEDRQQHDPRSCSTSVQLCKNPDFLRAFSRSSISNALAVAGVARHEPIHDIRAYVDELRKKASGE